MNNLNNSRETAPGHQRAWNLLEKLGEGDAGEVFRVESLIDQKQGVLKRPQRNAFPSDLVRQASQIQKEAAILAALSRIESPARIIRVPELLDQSRPGTEFTERFFIVISYANGINLGMLLRLLHQQGFDSNQAAQQLPFSMSDDERFLLQDLIEQGRLPPMLILRLLYGLIEYLEAVHHLEAELPAGLIHGILWNDVKFDHIFWDPAVLRFTLIDWGNGQFLEKDGITRDRQFSRQSDFRQILDEGYKLLSDQYPKLIPDLSWQTDLTHLSSYVSIISEIKDRAYSLLHGWQSDRHKLRLAEKDLCSKTHPTQADLTRLDEIHREIFQLAELPDFGALEVFCFRYAHNLLLDDKIDELLEFCQFAASRLIKNQEAFHLIGQLAVFSKTWKIPSSKITPLFENDWETVFWELGQIAFQQNLSSDWEDLRKRIRALVLGDSKPPPFVVAKRLAYALEDQKNQASDSQEHEKLIRAINSSVIPRWLEIEPDPPGCGIAYDDIWPILNRVYELNPSVVKQLQEILNQVESFIQIAIDSWQHQDFTSAQAALKRAFILDPDRVRFFQAGAAIKSAVDWLVEIQSGPNQDEPLIDFVTRLELVGREMRNQVAPAVWLDALIDALKSLRNGIDPTEVMINQPEARQYLDWLITLDPRRPLIYASGEKPKKERGEAEKIPLPASYGVKEFKLGDPSGLVLREPLDLWVPEARGSSARLFLGIITSKKEQNIQAAIKIMRPDRIEYALPLFKEEVQVLSIMRDVPGVVPLIETGFIKLDEQGLPSETDLSTVNVKGDGLRYGVDSVHNYLADLDLKLSEGWLPYIAIVRYDYRDNLLLTCDLGHTHGKFLPILNGLVMAIQACEVLEAAHARNIIYRDHKILHYYWRESVNGLFLIDWNVAKHYSQGLSTAEIRFDLIQFAARALHYIVTGRSAPGSLPIGPNTPEEIEAAALIEYTPTWNFDDQRLPADIKQIIEIALSGGYLSARQMREDLIMIYEKLSDLIEEE